MGKPLKVKQKALNFGGKMFDRLESFAREKFTRLSRKAHEYEVEQVKALRLIDKVFISIKDVHTLTLVV